MLISNFYIFSGVLFDLHEDFYLILSQEFPQLLILSTTICTIFQKLIAMIANAIRKTKKVSSWANVKKSRNRKEAPCNTNYWRVSKCIRAIANYIIGISHQN